MLNHIAQETRICAQEMHKAMKVIVKDRNLQRQYHNITGYYESIFSSKPMLGLGGRRYSESDYFGTFSFKDNKLWVRMQNRDLEKYPDSAYIDFNSPYPCIYFGSQYYRKHYQPVPIPAKQFEILKECVKDIIRYQDIYGCKGFMFRMNYLRVVMFVVFDQQDNPYHLSDGYGSVERFLYN